MIGEKCLWTLRVKLRNFKIITVMVWLNRQLEICARIRYVKMRVDIVMSKTCIAQKPEPQLYLFFLWHLNNVVHQLQLTLFKISHLCQMYRQHCRSCLEYYCQSLYSFEFDWNNYLIHLITWLFVKIIICAKTNKKNCLFSRFYLCGR